MELMKMALTLIALGLFALLFLKPGSPEFYIDVFGLIICSFTAILSFLKLRRSSGR